MQKLSMVPRMKLSAIRIWNCLRTRCDQIQLLYRDTEGVLSCWNRAKPQTLISFTDLIISAFCSQLCTSIGEETLREKQRDSLNSMELCLRETLCCPESESEPDSLLVYLYFAIVCSHR